MTSDSMNTSLWKLVQRLVGFLVIIKVECQGLIELSFDIVTTKFNEEKLHNSLWISKLHVNE